MVNETELEKLGQVELADMCSQLWDKYFETDSIPARTQLAVDYNLTACIYNRHSRMTPGPMRALLPDTKNYLPEGMEDVVAAKPMEAFKEPSAPAAKEARPKKEKAAAVPKTVLGGSFQSTTEPMPLTPEIESILAQEVSGAEKIRQVYFLNPEAFNVADFVRHSGIDRGRVVGCLKKLAND